MVSFDTVCRVEFEIEDKIRDLLKVALGGNYMIPP